MTRTEETLRIPKRLGSEEQQLGNKWEEGTFWKQPDEKVRALACEVRWVRVQRSPPCYLVGCEDEWNMSFKSRRDQRPVLSWRPAKPEGARRAVRRCCGGADHLLLLHLLMSTKTFRDLSQERRQTWRLKKTQGCLKSFIFNI